MAKQDGMQPNELVPISEMVTKIGVPIWHSHSIVTGSFFLEFLHTCDHQIEIPSTSFFGQQSSFSYLGPSLGWIIPF